MVVKRNVKPQKPSCLTSKAKPFLLTGYLDRLGPIHLNEGKIFTFTAVCLKFNIFFEFWVGSQPQQYQQHYDLLKSIFLHYRVCLCLEFYVP